MLSNLCKNYVVQLHDFRMFWFVSYLLDWEMYLLSVTKNPMQPLRYAYYKLTHWLQERFAKKCVFDILVLFKLDLCQISFWFGEKCICNTTGCFATNTAFYHIVTRACAEIKVLRVLSFEFLDKQVTYIFRLFDFWNFFCLPFFSFSFLFAAVIDLLLGLLAVRNF